MNCYSTGSVQGTDYIGGVCGYHVGSSAIIADTFWDIEASDNSTGYTLSSTTPGDISNVLGKTTVEMQTVDTFLNVGWDFCGEVNNGTEDNWRSPYQVGYPILYWQRDIPGDTAGSYGVNLVDFAVFADCWMSQTGDSNFNANCNLNNSDSSENVIDMADLLIFCENWLKGI